VQAVFQGVRKHLAQFDREGLAATAPALA